MLTGIIFQPLGMLAAVSFIVSQLIGMLTNHYTQTAKMVAFSINQIHWLLAAGEFNRWEDLWK